MRVNVKVILGVVVVLAIVTLGIEPRNNGFYCNDQSIRRPFLALQIPLSQLMVTCFILPIVIVVVIENMIKTMPQSAVKSIIYHNIIAFIFGLIINFLVVMLAKNLFGRLRPHTISFCNANHYCSEGNHNSD